MHSYLKTIGFSDISRRDLKEILEDIVEHYDEKTVIEDHEEGMFAEFSKNFGCDCGISVCGQYDEKGVFQMEYYYPFFRGTGITTQEHVVVEKHAEKESYAGACDDLRIGVTLIFYLQNPAEYLRESRKEKTDFGQSLTLSGLAAEGKILFPVEKDKELVKIEKESTKARNQMIAAARNGDEDAIESLTMEDMDTYSMITRRIETEDIFTIVDSYFMPYGIECDQYGVMGEILDFMFFKNILTGDEICQMTLETNDVQFDVIVNKKDLLGEPAVGRRFKGNIWLQGQLHC